MAYSVDSMSERDTCSDELLDRYCDPCFRNGSVEQVAGYCSKCVEFYCRGCLHRHRRFSTLVRHAILSGEDMPSSHADKPVKYELCETHNGESRDRFCSDHCVIICGICVIRQHNNCNVKPVSDVCKTLNMSTEEQLLRQGAKLLLKYAKNVKQSVKDNTNRLDKEKESIVKEAKEHRDKIIQQANKSFHDFNMELMQLYKERKDILATNKTGTDQIIAEIEFLLHTQSKSEGVRQFLDLCVSADRLQLCADKIKSLDVTITHIQSTFNMHIQPLSELQCKLGEISLEKFTFQMDSPFPDLYNPYRRHAQDGNQPAKSSSTIERVKLAKKDKINVKLKVDIADCNITGLDTTVNGTVLLADHDNCKLKVISPAGQLLSSLTLSIKPIGVAVINKTEAAVTMQNKQIGILEMADSGDLTLKRIMTTEQYVGGITVYKNNLIVTCDKSADGFRSVQMIDMRGKVLWTKTIDAEGKKLFAWVKTSKSNTISDWAWFLTTCSRDDDDTVIITDWKKQSITVLDAGTRKVVKVCDVIGKVPYGVTADDNGNVYVCYKSGDISVWSTTMEVEKSLVSGSAFLKSPLAIACNRMRGELLLSSTENSNFIHRYRISMT